MKKDILSKWNPKGNKSTYTHIWQSRCQTKIRRNKEGHFILIRETIHLEDTRNYKHIHTKVQHTQFHKTTTTGQIDLKTVIVGCWSQQWDLACVSWYLALWESSKELGQKPQDQTVPMCVWVGTWPCEKAPRNWGKSLRPDYACVSRHLALWESSKELGQKSQTRLCLCELVSGLVRKPDIQKNNIQGSQMASCPSDVNKKVMLTMCFSCFSVPVLKET
jgi:hypothetical protein